MVWPRVVGQGSRRGDGSWKAGGCHRVVWVLGGQAGVGLCTEHHLLAPGKIAAGIRGSAPAGRRRCRGVEASGQFCGGGMRRCLGRAAGQGPGPAQHPSHGAVAGCRP